MILEKVSRLINKWVEFSLFGLGFTMAIIVAVQVFCRYVLNYSLFWSEELARYLLVWLTFLGASVAYRKKAHPGIDVLYQRLSDQKKKYTSLIIHLVSISLFVVMVVFGLKFSYFIRMQISPALYLPKWTIFSIIPISGVILIIHGLNFFLNELKRNPIDS